MAWKKQAAGTKHNDNCTMKFGKLSAHNNCPRCQELKAGAEPRKWTAARGSTSSLDAYCFSVPIYAARCTAETNPACNCGKMSYTD